MLSSDALYVILLHLGVLILYLVLRRPLPILRDRSVLLGCYLIALAGYGQFLRDVPLSFSLCLAVCGAVVTTLGVMRTRRKRLHRED